MNLPAPTRFLLAVARRMAKGGRMKNRAMNPDPPPSSDSAVDTQPSALGKWWVYQRERFPLFGHGLPIAAFSFSAVCFSRLLRGGEDWPRWEAAVVAFLTAFLFFLQLRIADEFKDFEEDSRYRPYRPVPRGLVTLRELAWVGIAAAVVQLALALWLVPSLALLLAGVWLYLVLMSKEFFAAVWLKRRAVIYMLSHMVIVPLIDFYATACDWWPAQGHPPAGLFWFVVVSYFNGLVIEIGRKIRAPADEEEGVPTYSVAWGRRTAVCVWLAVMAATAGCAVCAMAVIDFAIPVAVWLGSLLAVAMVVAVWFLRSPVARSGKHIEFASGLWTIGLYLSIGVIPLAWRLLISRS
jgi:4-hydroxybenzoate polyprenyltransferase